MKYNSKIVLAYFAECGLPKPELEFRFSPDRKWRFDFGWDGFIVGNGAFQYCPVNGADKQIKVALEVDGGIWIRGGHNRGAQMKKDWEKRNAAAQLGWRILYVEPKDLCTAETVEMIRRCLS